MPKKRIPYKALALKAGAEIKKSQAIDYAKLRTVCGGVGTNTLQKVLLHVDKAGITGHVGKRRRVLVNPDGTAKPDITVNEKPRKKRRTRKVKVASTPAPATAAEAQPAAAPHANGQYSLAQKQAKLVELAKTMDGSEAARILQAVIDDLKIVDRASQMVVAVQEALKT